MQWTGLNELREKYLSFFEGKGHLRLDSFPLVPKDDPSLLLINSGMAPMKKWFLAQEEPPRHRVTTCQKCIRTPDIERVGITARHGTFFEMLGNFSFQDYFKEEVIPWAWEFLTSDEWMAIPKDKLHISVYEEDDEAGSVHNEPNKVLAEICASEGQHAYIGKVVMDLPSQCPDYYRDPSPQAALDATEDFLTYCRDLNGRTRQDIIGVVTPRFIPTCSDEVLYGLGDLARRYDAPVQSHCSEGDWEHAHVLERTGLSDTQAHLKYGLLTNKTTLAHSVYLSDFDAALYKEHGAAIAHSPLSNILFAGAVCPVKRRLEQGLSISLATDISAGYTPSMFDSMRQAILSSRLLSTGTDFSKSPIERGGIPHSVIDFRQAFYMATVGGATTLHANAGQFRKGCRFDAFVFDCLASQSQTRQYDTDSLADMLQKIIFTGQRQNITALWVSGKPVSLH